MLFDAVIVRDFNEMAEEIARQAGKTTGVVESVVFLMCVLDLILGREVGIGFFAPRYEQAKTDWDRVKDIMPTVAPMFGLMPVEDNAHTMSYVRPIKDLTGKVSHYQKAVTMYAFSMGESTKLESKTLDIAIMEESHDINDIKYEKEVLPMMTATNGVSVWIGVAGYRLCKFKTLCEECAHKIIVPVEEVIKSRRKAYEETGDAEHLAYEQFFNQVMERAGGVRTDEIRTQYDLEWITERGNFVTRKQLEKCRKKFLCVAKPDVVIGVDLGKHTDPTVATASTTQGQRLKSMEMIGTDYMLQLPMLFDWIQTEFIDRGYNVVLIRYDATSMGDVVGEMLEKESRWEVEGFIFSQIAKANMFQNLSNLIVIGCGISDNAVEDTGQRRFEYWEGCPNVNKFEHEMCDMEKEYKGDKQILSCHHPARAGAHDDYCDSEALSVDYEHTELTFMTLS